MGENKAPPRPGLGGAGSHWTVCHQPPPPGEGFITSLGHVIALAHIYGKAGKNVSENHISCTPQPGLGGPGDPVPTPSL